MNRLTKHLAALAAPSVPELERPIVPGEPCYAVYRFETLGWTPRHIEDRPRVVGIERHSVEWISCHRQLLPAVQAAREFNRSRFTMPNLRSWASAAYAEAGPFDMASLFTRDVLPLAYVVAQLTLPRTIWQPVGLLDAPQWRWQHDCSLSRLRRCASVEQAVERCERHNARALNRRKKTEFVSWHLALAIESGAQSSIATLDAGGLVVAQQVKRFHVVDHAWLAKGGAR